MEKIDTIAKFHSGLTKYVDCLEDDIANKPYRHKMTKIDACYAIAGIIAYDIQKKKEQIVEKEEGLNYSSKMSDDFLDNMAQGINSHLCSIGNSYKFKDGIQLITIVRHKIAHGDYILRDTDYVLNIENNEVPIPILLFAQLYIPSVEGLEHRLNGNSYSKKILVNKSNLALKHPITTEKDLQEFLGLQIYKEYILRRKDNKEMTSKEKMLFESIIWSTYETTTNENIKEQNNNLIKYFDKLGYYVTIKNNKIKNPALIEKIKKAINNINNAYECYKAEMNMDKLSYQYGHYVSRIIDNEYNSDSIDAGVRLNIEMLKLIYVTENSNIDDIMRLFSKQYPLVTANSLEIMATTYFAKFYPLYCYPFDDIYKIDNNYRLNREEEFDFGKLNLEEIVPNVLEIDTRGIEEAKNNLIRGNKDLDKITNKINKYNNYVNGLSKKSNLNPKEQLKLDEFKKALILLEQEQVEAYDRYMNLQLEYQAVIDDYKNNYDYFRNKAIIEGMRNSIAHGNVTIEDIGVDKYINDLKLKFTNIYEGKICFQVSLSLYEFKSLYDSTNINAIWDYLDEKDNKVKQK